MLGSIRHWWQSLGIWKCPNCHIRLNHEYYNRCYRCGYIEQTGRDALDDLKWWTERKINHFLFRKNYGGITIIMIIALTVWFMLFWRQLFP